jgi:hypothetical protein
MVAARDLAKAQAKTEKKNGSSKPPVEPAPLEFAVEETPEYQDQEREFAELETGQYVSEENPLTSVIREMTGGKLSGHTDLTETMAVLFTQIRIMEDTWSGAEYKEWSGYLNLGTFPNWFEIYRLSVGRKSRGETVDMGKGQPAYPPDPTRLPNRGF